MASKSTALNLLPGDAETPEIKSAPAVSLDTDFFNLVTYLQSTFNQILYFQSIMGTLTPM